MGVVLRQVWSKSQRTVLMGYLTVSTNVRRYQTHHRWQFVFFQEDRAQVHCACHSPIEWKMWFSCFPILPGSAEAQVIWGGIVKRLFDCLLYRWHFCRKISKSIYVCQSYSKPKVGCVFFETLCSNVCCVPTRSKLNKTFESTVQGSASVSSRRSSTLSLMGMWIPKPSRPGQLSLLPPAGREISTSQSAATILRLAVKGRYGSFHLWMHVWVAGGWCDPLLTRAIPECLEMSDS